MTQEHEVCLNQASVKNTELNEQFEKQKFCHEVSVNLREQVFPLFWARAFLQEPWLLQALLCRHVAILLLYRQQSTAGWKHKISSWCSSQVSHVPCSHPAALQGLSVPRSETAPEVQEVQEKQEVQEVQQMQPVGLYGR